MIHTASSLLPEFPFQELRLDALPEPLSALPAVCAFVRSHPETRFLATCRPVRSGGQFAGSATMEFAVLLQAAQGGFAFTDLALESAEELPVDALAQLKATGAAVLLSWHDFKSMGDLPSVLARMRRFAPDLGKIVPTAHSLNDNFPLLRAVRSMASEGFPLVGLCMGEPGVPSRVLGLRAGSAFTFAAATSAQATAPGQIAAHTLRDLYRVQSLGEGTRVYGVAGDPIHSSLSPQMHNGAFRESEQDAVYLPLQTRNASDLFHFARMLPLAGFSVTMPLKQAVLPLLQPLDPIAARIGAVNTVRQEADGTFSGFNTDVAGIVVPLEQRLSLKGARVLVLGAGGAARAAAFGCADRGARVSVLNRTPAAAAALAREAKAEQIFAEQLPHLPEFDVLIQATPAGMRGGVAALPCAVDHLRSRLVFDLVYNPLETSLLRAARERRLETISGVEMFVHQGARQFELWTGKPAPVDTMRETVMAALRDAAIPG